MQQWKQGPEHVGLFAMLLCALCFLGVCTVHFWLHYSADTAFPPSGSHSLSSFSLSQRLRRSTTVHRNRRSGPSLVHDIDDAHPPSSDLAHPDTHPFPSPAIISPWLYHPQTKTTVYCTKGSIMFTRDYQAQKDKSWSKRRKKSSSFLGLFYDREARCILMSNYFSSALFMFFFSCLFQ